MTTTHSTPGTLAPRTLAARLTRLGTWATEQFATNPISTLAWGGDALVLLARLPVAVLAIVILDR